jgi:uncharacterized repeat protein (TIGR01451 family)
MEKKKTIKNLILIPLLIISLVAFNFPIAAALAEGEDSDPDPTEGTCTENCTEEETPEPYCGDGNLDEAEQCDQAAENGIECVPEYGSSCSYCSSECQTIELQRDFCGNGNLDEGNEECDDGNKEDGDGCSAGCIIEEETPTVNENEEVVDEEVVNEENNNDETPPDNTPDAIIETGDADVLIGVFNTTNSDITGSDFDQFLYNIIGAAQGDIDLSDELHTGAPEECENCSDFNVTNTSEGNIENNILVDASTGNNTANSGSGDAIIKTGDANVSVNVVNILNTNIIGSNWTQIVINVLGDWTGDLLFPGKEAIIDFLKNRTPSCGDSCQDIDITNQNSGDIENEIYVQADTGGNEASGNSSIIRTGSSNARNTILNFANTNIVDRNFFFMAVNNYGRWEGNVFSLPPGLEINESPDGIKIYNVNEGEDSIQPEDGNSVEVINNNTGKIKNSIVVNVSTGQNSATAPHGEASIQTGDANVITNLINFLNSNIVGNNFLLGMINILGSWQGNIAFGRPDLWLGENAITSRDPVWHSSTITYTLTYANNGDADATGVTLLDNFDENHLDIMDVGGAEIIPNPGELKWDLGTVPAGASGQVTYTVVVNNTIPYGTSYITNQSQIDSFEPDYNDQDNGDTLEIAAFGFQEYIPAPVYQPVLTIAKTSKVKDFATSPGTADYTIKINNISNASAYNVLVKDVLRDSSSKEFNTYQWDLGEVFPKEEIIIDYTVQIGPEVPAGFYTNTAQITYIDAFGIKILPIEASTQIEIRVKTPSEEPAEETVSLDDIENQLFDIAGKIRLINDEVQRRIAELPREQEPAETIVERIQEIFTPTVSAQTVFTPIAEEAKKRGWEKLLAAVNSFSPKLFDGISIASGAFLSLFFIMLAADKRRNGNGNGNGKKDHKKSNWFIKFIHSFFA